MKVSDTLAKYALTITMLKEKQEFVIANESRICLKNHTKVRKFICFKHKTKHKYRGCAKFNCSRCVWESKLGDLIFMPDGKDFILCPKCFNKQHGEKIKWNS